MPQQQQHHQNVDALKSAMTQKQLSLMAIQNDRLDFCMHICYRGLGLARIAF